MKLYPAPVREKYMIKPASLLPHKKKWATKRKKSKKIVFING